MTDDETTSVGPGTDIMITLEWAAFDALVQDRNAAVELLKAAHQYLGGHDPGLADRIGAFLDEERGL